MPGGLVKLKKNGSLNPVYVGAFKTVDEMRKFLSKHILTMLTQEIKKIQILCMKVMESSIKKTSHKENQDKMASPANYVII